MIDVSKYHLLLLLLLIGVIPMACDTPEVKSYDTIGYIQSIDPRFDAIVSPDTQIEVIASGYNWTEGPVWVSSEDCLLYSDVPENKIYKWTESKGAVEYLSGSGYSGSEKSRPGSNGLTLDLDGQLILCRSGDREIGRMTSSIDQPTAIFETIANNYKGLKFNSPNDIIADRRGNYYFTDPNFGLQDTTTKETKFQGVYRIDPTGKVKLMTDDCPQPNGVGLSPDERTLYVANSRPAKLYAYNLTTEGVTSNGRILFDASEIYASSISNQPPDGMVINKDGIIFMTGPDGVLVFNPEGQHLGTIRTDRLTSNCTFNNDESVLYVTSDGLVLRVRLKLNNKS